jgi:itaconate CoA-transferase
MEQALIAPYATLRFAQLGWRVIRIESTPSGEGLPGDPNRYIGGKVADDDRRSYFIAPNVGKEAIALNLKDPEGPGGAAPLITELDADVFCCNTVPKRYKQLGIDYESLAAVKPDLIWAGISAMGPEYPEAPGYDPVIQAMAGYMELTGPGRRPADAVRRAADRPQGRRRSLCRRDDGAARTRRDRQRVAHRCLDAAGRRVLADHHPAAARLQLRPVGDHALRQRASQVHPDQRLSHRRRLHLHGHRQRRAVAAPDRDSLVCAGGQCGARHQRRPRREREAIHRDMAAATRRVATADIAAAFRQATIPHAAINDIPAVREWKPSPAR